MKRITIFLIAIIMLAGQVRAQESSTSSQEVVSEMVSRIANAVQLSATQIENLQNSVTQYVHSIEQANAAYSTNDSLLIVHKADAWQNYLMDVRDILTDEQYSAYMQHQRELQQQITSQLKQNK